MEHALPVAIALLSFWASIVYAFNHAWFPALYWFSAFLLNVSVLGMTLHAKG